MYNNTKEYKYDTSFVRRRPVSKPRSKLNILKFTDDLHEKLRKTYRHLSSAVYGINLSPSRIYTAAIEIETQ